MNLLIRRARRRLISGDLLSHGAVAASAALLAFILLLIAGTQILDWRWLLVLPLAAVASGLFLAWTRRPTDYLVAQILDHRLELADTLSTAAFFREGETRGHALPEIRLWQREQAARLAATVDVRAAIPFVLPRALYAVAVLVLVASSLFALRYGLSQRLDLRPPLARMLEQKFGVRDKTEEARQAHRKSARASEPDYAGTAVDQDDLRAGEPDRLPDLEEQSSGRPDADRTYADGSKNSARKQAEQAADSDPNAQLDKLPPDDDEDDPGGPPPPAQGKSGQDRKPAAKRPPENEASNLLSKLQDAMNKMLSRLNLQQPKSAFDDDSSTTQSSRTERGKSKDGKGKAAAKGDRKQNGEQGDPQSGEDSSESAAAQNGQAKGDGKSDSDQPSKQPGSGIGSKDGAKDIKLAEQLEAMGKISEILGKRSANLTGEATVEVQSTTQELHTPYAQRRAEHTEGGVEIGRDEVPVALETYVEQYFEQVRKPAPKK